MGCHGKVYREIIVLVFDFGSFGWVRIDLQFDFDGLRSAVKILIAEVKISRWNLLLEKCS